LGRPSTSVNAVRIPKAGTESAMSATAAVAAQATGRATTRPASLPHSRLDRASVGLATTGARQSQGVDPVTKHGQQRRQHRGRGEDGHSDDQRRADGQRGEQPASDEHPRHGHHDREARDDDGSTGRRSGKDDGVLDARAGCPFLAGAAHDEQRVVDTDC
jgi:hypothetical protein